MSAILIIEDEFDLADLVRLNLQADGHAVQTASTAAEGMAILRRQGVDLLILDLMLPGGMDGLELCRMLRRDEKLAALPIIMLTAKSQELDRVLGLELGADDYLTKPFSMRELLARVKALLRRAGGQVAEGPGLLEAGIILLDTVRHELRVQGQLVELTTREFSLLEFMLRHPGRLLGRDYLLDRVWELSGEIESRTVDVHVRRLRGKLGPAAVYIRTIHGSGYKFQPDTSPDGTD